MSPTIMNFSAQVLWKELQSSHSGAEARGLALAHVVEMTPGEFTSFVEQLAALVRGDASCRAAEWWPSLILALVTWSRRHVRDRTDAAAAATAALYTHLGPTCPSRGALLGILTERRKSTELATFTRLMTTDPPQGGAAAGAPLVPLFDADEAAAKVLFPALLAGITHPDAAPAILDLANHLTRTGVLAQHPATPRVQELIVVLRGLTGRLETVQEGILNGTPDTAAREQLQTTIPLAIAICDTLGLIGDPTARSGLSELLSVRHRRLRVEAAAALARLADEEGAQTLLELAAEPSVRLRVLAYAEEIDLSERLDERWTSPVAIAEAELVAFLSDSLHLGLPPTSCELIDSRTLSWPGFEEPRMCYLFRFTYRAERADGTETSYSNVGVAGPLAHAFRGDLTHLPVDDIYAAFAGWQAEHEEIQEIDVTATSPPRDPRQRREIADAMRRLEEHEYADIEILQLGRFFGDSTVVATARRGGITGVVVVDPVSCCWLPQRSLSWPLTPAEAYCIYKGRRLLAAFNE